MGVCVIVCVWCLRERQRVWKQTTASSNVADYEQILSSKVKITLHVMQRFSFIWVYSVRDIQLSKETNVIEFQRRFHFNFLNRQSTKQTNLKWLSLEYISIHWDTSNIIGNYICSKRTRARRTHTYSILVEVVPK